MYPFHPLQSFLDQKASFALAACLSRMGSSVQLLSRGAQPQGFFLEISCLEEPSKEWLNEWFRQASLLMKEEWPMPVEMTSENLKLFWKQKGQYLRARQLGMSSLLSVVCWPGFIEPFDLDEMGLQPMRFDALILLGIQPVMKEIKGHREKIWIVQGKVAPTSEARKVLTKLKPGSNRLTQVKSLLLTPSQMLKVLKVQTLWLEALEAEPSSLICLREEKSSANKSSSSKIEGFRWIKEHAQESLGYASLWLEPEFESIFFGQTAQNERVQSSLSFLLRMISKIAKILELEVNCSLRASSHPAMRSWLDLFEAESFSPLSLIEEETGGKPQLVWQMSVSQDRMTWWPLAEMSLNALDSTRWRLEAKPVISFYRWAAAIGTKAIE